MIFMDCKGTDYTYYQPTTIEINGISGTDDIIYFTPPLVSTAAFPDDWYINYQEEAKQLDRIEQKRVLAMLRIPSKQRLIYSDPNHNTRHYKVQKRG